MSWYGVAPTLNILFLPLLIAIMVLTAASVGLWLSILAAQFRDVRFAVQFVGQILMYAAPVVWPASLIPGKYRIFYGFYPMAGVIEGFRSALLATNPMPWDLIIPGVIGAVVLFITGLLYFRRAERILADVA
jgi:lipopolysaccharide transport system permease protein